MAVKFARISQVASSIHASDIDCARNSISQRAAHMRHTRWAAKLVQLVRFYSITWLRWLRKKCSSKNVLQLETRRADKAATSSANDAVFAFSFLSQIEPASDIRLNAQLGIAKISNGLIFLALPAVPAAYVPVNINFDTSAKST